MGGNTISDPVERVSCRILCYYFSVGGLFLLSEHVVSCRLVTFLFESVSVILVNASRTF